MAFRGQRIEALGTAGVEMIWVAMVEFEEPVLKYLVESRWRGHEGHRDTLWRAAGNAY